MKFILELKHWQLFLLLLFLYLLQGRLDKGGIIVDLIILLIVVGWTWALGTHGQKILAANNIARKSTGLFAFNITYLCVFFISMIENVGEYFWGTTVVYSIFLIFPVVGIWVIQPLANKWVQKQGRVQY